MPSRGRVTSLCRETHGLADVELEVVEAIRLPCHLGEQTTPLIQIFRMPCSQLHLNSSSSCPKLMMFMVRHKM
jgi:hypothetical protein